MSGRQNNGCQNIEFLFLFCTFYDIGLITWGQVTVVAYLGLGCLIMINVFELDGDSIQSGLGRMHFFFCQDHRYMVLVAAAHVGANQFCANHNQQSTILWESQSAVVARFANHLVPVANLRKIS